jgi:hypothetical protein
VANVIPTMAPPQTRLKRAATTQLQDDVSRQKHRPRTATKVELDAKTLADGTNGPVFNGQVSLQQTTTALEVLDSNLFVNHPYSMVNMQDHASNCGGLHTQAYSVDIGEEVLHISTNGYGGSNNKFGQEFEYLNDERIMY